MRYRIIRVKKCSNCPYLKMADGKYLTQCMEEHIVIENDNLDRMPRWCPLEREKKQ